MLERDFLGILSLVDGRKKEVIRDLVKEDEVSKLIECVSEKGDFLSFLIEEPSNVLLAEMRDTGAISDTEFDSLLINPVDQLIIKFQ